jgi:hypothetical protein
MSALRTPLDCVRFRAVHDHDDDDLGVSAEGERGHGAAERALGLARLRAMSLTRRAAICVRAAA